jgi:hypothetical protein
MSRLGQNLITFPDVAKEAKGACEEAGKKVDEVVDGAVNGAKDTFNDVKDALPFGRRDAGDVVTDVCNKGAEIANKAVQLTSDLVDKALGSVAKAVGVKEYYSLHIGTLCEGYYQPIWSDTNAKPNVEKCSKKFYTGKTDISKKLDEELGVGPFKFKLSDIGLVEDIQKAFDMIPRALAAMAFFFLFSTLALVAGFLLSGATLAFEYTMQSFQKFALLGALGFTGFGWFTSLVGGIVVTVASNQISEAVNTHGGKFGISASTGSKLYSLVWASVAFSTITLALLGFVLWRTRNGRGMMAQQHYAEKNYSGSTMEDSHGFAQMPTAGGQGQFKEEPL